MPTPLKDAIQAHIIESDILEGKALFGTKSKGAKMTASAFSTYVGDTMCAILGKRAGVNILRHSRITDFLRSKRITVAQRASMASKMAHSVSMQMMYDKHDVNPDAIPIYESDDEGEVVVTKIVPGDVKVKVKPDLDVKAAVAPKQKQKPKSKKQNQKQKILVSKPIPATPQQPVKSKRGAPNPRGRT